MPGYIPSDLEELRIPSTLPPSHQVSEVRPDLCRQFANIALPVLLSGLRYSEKFNICDTHPDLSRLTQLIFDQVVEKTGTFNGPAYASVSGYNLPDSLYGHSDSNGYHSDGSTETVAIVSISEQATLRVAWAPMYDADENFLTTTHALLGTEPVVLVTRQTKPWKFVRPVANVGCVEGTLVRLDQPSDHIKDDGGLEWDLEHGLYEARGPRISLQFRSHGADGDPDEEKAGRIPLYPSTTRLT